VGRLRKGGGGRTIELVVAIALLLAVVLYIGVVTLALVRRGVSGAFLALTGTAILGRAAAARNIRVQPPSQ
jgi:hypothetical protein